MIKPGDFAIIHGKLKVITRVSNEFTCVWYNNVVQKIKRLDQVAQMKHIELATKETHAEYFL